MHVTPCAAVLLLGTAVAASGCGGGLDLWHGPRGKGPLAAARAAEAADLTAKGDELAVEGAPRDDLDRALEAYARADELVGSSIDSMVRQARAILFITEPMAEGDESLALIERGEDLAGQIAQRAPERVEGHYYEALFIGLRARQKSVPKALLLLPKMSSRGRRAMEIDETYDDAGPLRLMGALLVTAPPWPTSVGDTDEGLELLERAVRVSDYPRNRLLFARALMEDDEVERGCRELEPLLRGQLDGRWARTAERWTAEARELADLGRCAPPGESGVVEVSHPDSM
jgi:hypothetical protein